MAVLDVNVGEDDRELGEVFEYRYVHFADLDRGIEVLVGFRDKLVEDFVLEEENRGYQGDQHGYQCDQDVKDYFPKRFQRLKNGSYKNTAKVKPNKV